MKRRSFKLFFVAGAALLLVMAAIGLIHHRHKQLNALTPPPEPPTSVQITVARQGMLPVTDHYLGRIVPVLSAALVPRVTGQLREVNGDVGDRVSRGDILAVLDDRVLRRKQQALAAELAGAKDDLQEREKQLARRQSLLRQKNVSREARDESRRLTLLARSRVKRLQAELEAAEASLADTRLRAPFAGIITARLQETGDLARPGQAVMKLEQPDKGYKILINIPPEVAAVTTAGNPVEIVAGKEKPTAAVYRVHPALPAGNLATVEVRLERRPGNLPSGAPVGVNIVRQQPAGLIIPLRCLLQQAETDYVFVVENGKQARKRAVSVLGRSGERAVVSGDDLSDGDRLVMGNEAMLLQLGPTAPIRVVREKTP